MKVHLQWLHQVNSHLLDLCVTVSPAGDQIFKYMNLWRHSHSNYHNEVLAHPPHILIKLFIVLIYLN